MKFLRVKINLTRPEEVVHDFRGMHIILLLFMLTQQVDLGCVGVHGKHVLIRIRDQYLLCDKTKIIHHNNCTC